jgi:hypothetical protein
LVGPLTLLLTAGLCRLLICLICARIWLLTAVFPLIFVSSVH